MWWSFLTPFLFFQKNAMATTLLSNVLWCRHNDATSSTTSWWPGQLGSNPPTQPCCLGRGYEKMVPLSYRVVSMAEEESHARSVCSSQGRLAKLEYGEKIDEGMTTVTAISVVALMRATVGAVRMTTKCFRIHLPEQHEQGLCREVDRQPESNIRNQKGTQAIHQAKTIMMEGYPLLVYRPRLQ